MAGSVGAKGKGKNQKAGAKTRNPWRGESNPRAADAHEKTTQKGYVGKYKKMVIGQLVKKKPIPKVSKKTRSTPKKNTPV